MSPKKRIPEPVDLHQVKRYSCAGRPTRTKINRFGSPLKKNSGAGFFESLPGYLKASDLNEFIALVARARRDDCPFHLLLGAHTIKVGLSPIIIDLMQRRI
ncbi:MAG: hypothetical protein OEW00_11195, partial [candidate division Zixibacteria bacterium]|nr:hypothetical protein [candidate division Zixibacteria bacterium]